MKKIVTGIGASPGRALGTVRHIRRRAPLPERRAIALEEVDQEITSFEAARLQAIRDTEHLRDETARRLGDFEAQIFEPQIVMLQDPDLIAGTLQYIRENFLPAGRAFDWRLTEYRTAITGAMKLMVVDRLADLDDIRARVLGHLAGANGVSPSLPAGGSVVATHEFTPTLAMQLDPADTIGIASANGSRTAHSAVLARSLGIPAVVGLGPELSRLQDGSAVLLDGSTGRITLDPDEGERRVHAERVKRAPRWGKNGKPLSLAPVTTADGVRIHLRANIDQPQDVDAARRVGAEGVGLFRSEFLVLGRRVMPSQEEQFKAYARVVEGFPNHPITLRTFDIGGDKFPLFLDTPPEVNPYLGWRAIRVCRDRPDLLRNQLRAAIRAGGRAQSMRVLVPFITSEDEILWTRQMLNEVCTEQGYERPPPLGVMVETPALAETLDLVAEHLDFLSLGTNDLTQYALAVDRGNARLQHLTDPLHPAMIRMWARVHDSASAADLDLGVCGDMAADPVGLALLIGLGYRDFSLSPSALPEIRELIQVLSTTELTIRTVTLHDRAGVKEVPGLIVDYLKDLTGVDTQALVIQ